MWRWLGHFVSVHEWSHWQSFQFLHVTLQYHSDYFQVPGCYCYSTITTSEFPIKSLKGNGKTQKIEQHLLTQLANQSNLLKQIHEPIYMHVFILEDKRSLLILPYWKITNFWCFLEFLIGLCLMIYLIEKLLKKAFKPWLSYIHWSTFIWNVCHF